MCIAGFTCQPFSAAGKDQGSDDEQGRGIILSSILEHIQRERPKACVASKSEKSSHTRRWVGGIVKAVESIAQPDLRGRGEQPGIV